MKLSRSERRDQVHRSDDTISQPRLIPCRPIRAAYFLCTTDQETIRNPHLSRDKPRRLEISWELALVGSRNTFQRLFFKNLF